MCSPPQTDLQDLQRQAIEKNAVEQGGLADELAEEHTHGVMNQSICQVCNYGKDWQAACPIVNMMNNSCALMCICFFLQGWRLNPRGVECLAHNGYHGICKLNGFFNEMDAIDKQMIEQRRMCFTLLS